MVDGEIGPLYCSFNFKTTVRNKYIQTTFNYRDNYIQTRINNTIYDEIYDESTNK